VLLSSALLQEEEELFAQERVREIEDENWGSGA